MATTKKHSNFKDQPEVKGKARILESAIQCFIEGGIAHTRMIDVAKKAGVNQPLVSYYFPTLDSLYVEVIQFVLKKVHDEVLENITPKSDRPVQILTHYIEAHFAWAQENSGYFSIGLYFYYLASFHQTFQELNDRIRQTGRDRIAAILYRGIEAKTFWVPAGMRVDQLALIIQGLITGNVILAATEKLIPWKECCALTVRTDLDLCTKKDSK